MIHVRKSEDRGLAEHGWLTARHTFSFAEYHDKNHMNFSVLRVLNEDRIQGGKGFGTHPHQNMEIITYVISGALLHKDSMGNSTTIKPGEVQRMSAGTGVQHSEINGMKDKETHLLQIWILPEKKGIPPSYNQKDFSAALQNQEFLLVASKQGRHGSVTLNQDVDMYALNSKKPGYKTHKTSLQRHIWIQVVSGNLRVNNTNLNAGDGARLEQTETIQLEWSSDVHFILFDMI